MTNAIGTSTVGNSASGYSPPVTPNSTQVAQTNNPTLAQLAVDLSTNAAVIATLGTASTGFQTYDAAGLLNTIAQAGSAPSTPSPAPSSNTNPQTSVQQSADQGVVSTLPSDTSAAGTYSSSGTMQNFSSTDASSNWAALLKTNPNLSGTVISESFAQGIISTLNTIA